MCLNNEEKAVTMAMAVYILFGQDSETLLHSHLGRYCGQTNTLVGTYQNNIHCLRGLAKHIYTGTQNKQ